MKKILKTLTFATLTFALTCFGQKKTENYATFSGKITNATSDSLMVFNLKDRGYKKVILLRKDGSFNDTIRAANNTAFFNFITPKRDLFGLLYLKNGLSVVLNADIKNQTVFFEGDGVVENTYYLKMKERRRQQEGNSKMSTPLYGDELIKVETERVKNNIAFLDTFKEKMDADFYKENLAIFQGTVENTVREMKKMEEKNEYLQKALKKGTPSPKFTDYENAKGGTTSFDDLKGKYLFIDIWASWCVPCINEIPFLKKLEDEYHGKNITFVSISVDDEKTRASWLKIIEKKELGGVQLLAKDSRNDKFILDYKLSGIPRFIIVDPSGNIVHSAAPSPSNPELKKLLDSLNL